MQQATKSIDIKVPENYDGQKVRVIVDKDCVRHKPAQFVAFRIPHADGFLPIGNKRIPLDDFYRMLRKEGGLSDHLPLKIDLSTLAIQQFDQAPDCYSAQRQWPFQWKGVKCSLAGSVSIRVHDVDYETALSTLKDIRESALALWKEPCPLECLKIYTPHSGGGITWTERQMRVRRQWDTIYIEESIKHQLIQSLERFYRSESLYDDYGRTWKRIYLFHGPPGTGKTSTVLALASAMGRHLCKLSISGNTRATQVEGLFQYLPSDCFMLLEDVDALFDGRNNTTGLTFSGILNMMDGVETKRGLVLFMTTNHLASLDPALCRTGRVDEVIQFNLPTHEDYKQALLKMASKWPHEHELYIEYAMEMNQSIATVQEHLFCCMIEERVSILSK